MTYIKDLHDLGKSLVERRYPLSIEISIIGENPPVFAIAVTNVTKDHPLIVHETRVHYGNSDYSHAFVLSPFEKQSIPPKDKVSFQLDYDTCRIIKRMTSISPPTIDSPLSLNGPEELFRAIANGEEIDSWIEIDFNEHRQRSFKKRKVKAVFAEMLRIGKRRSV